MNPPKMPIHIGDYRRDTGHLRAAGHGAYLLLMFHYWATGKLPDDDEQLSAIACMSRSEWRKHKPILQGFFQNGWKKQRIDDDLAAAKSSYERRAAAGEKGGKAKASPKQSSSNATAPPEQPLTLNHTNLTEEAKNASSVVALAAKRGSRLPEDWYPSDADLKFAGELGLRLYEIDGEIPKFLDYWKAKAGPNAVKRDWSATWRNWIRKTAESRRNGNGARAPTVHEVLDLAIARARGEEVEGDPAMVDVTPGRT